MTTIQLEIPEDLVESIRRNGRLNQDGLREMLRDALRAKANAFIDDVTGRTERLGIPHMSEEEIQDAIDAVRTRKAGGMTITECSSSPHPPCWKSIE